MTRFPRPRGARPSSRLQAHALALVVASAVSGGLIFACSSSSNSSPGGTSTSGNDGSTSLTDGGASGDGSTSAMTAEQLFRAFQTDLVTTCGGTGGQCHVNGTYHSAPQWLGPGDPYTTAKAYPGIIPADNVPTDSKLLSQVEHEGPALSDTPTLYAEVKQWVAAEITGKPLLSTALFTIQDGANTVDLTSLAGGLGGVKLTFSASHTSSQATLVNMQITAPAPKGLHIVDPYFVLVPNGPVVDDTSNGFVGETPLDVAPGQTVDFFDGALILRPYVAGEQVKIVFSQFALEEPTDAGVASACKSVTTFQSSALPAFMQTYDLVDGGSSTCLTCHGGGDNVAVNAMDLTAFSTDPSTACEQALYKLTTTNLELSPLILTPMGLDGGDEYHPVRSAGQAYHDAILGWGQNEE